MADAANTETAWSLKDVMVALDAKLADYADKLEEIRKFYENWTNAMASWKLDNIAAAK